MKKIPDFEFARLLMRWNRLENKRQMPWKGERDPYKIWLSEIILQQTRVEQGIDYYQSFIKSFPTIQKLANAPENKIYKLWEGLGYYNRCKNLIATARDIANNRNGQFPSDVDELRKLKGIGPYTAAAVSSFAFNKPHAVVDGNVYRVLARIFGVKKQIDSIEGKNFFHALADRLLDKTQPGLYNQAIMDFGALVCKPQPDCQNCPFRKSCKAFSMKTIDKLPVKGKKSPVHKRWFYYVVGEYEGKFGIQQRTENEIWQNLFQFSLIETKSEKSDRYILTKAIQNKILNKNSFELVAVSENYRQQLSHQTIYGKFFRIKHIRTPENNHQLNWVSPASLKKFAFPKLINQYLQENMNGSNHDRADKKFRFRSKSF